MLSGCAEEGKLGYMGGAYMLHLRELEAVFVLFRETERLWENWLIAKTATTSEAQSPNTLMTNVLMNHSPLNLAILRLLIAPNSIRTNNQLLSPSIIKVDGIGSLLHANVRFEGISRGESC